MSKFYDSLTKDDRADWRAADATRFALAMLREQQADAERDARVFLKAGENHQAAVAVGKADGISHAIDMMEKDE